MSLDVSINSAEMMTVSVISPTCELFRIEAAVESGANFRRLGKSLIHVPNSETHPVEKSCLSSASRLGF